jgi:hypothetical protein
VNKKPILLALLLFAAPGYAATHAAVDCSKAEIDIAVAAASNGDTVTVPAGVCTWTSLVTIAKAITLQGAGVGQTIIQDGITTSGRLMTWTLVSVLNSRMTGIEFRGDFNGDGLYLVGEGERTTSPDHQAYNGVIGIDGQSGAGPYDARRMRIDHCKFDHLNGVHLRINMAWGVIDRNTFLLKGSQYAFYFFSPAEYAYSDAQWAAATDLGGENFMFVENNTITRDTSTYACSDSYAGARWVARYNTTTLCHWEAHGTESAGRARGTRAVEIYENTMTGPTQGNYLANIRSGTGVIYNNTMTNMSGSTVIHCADHRKAHSFSPWTSADGTNVWDVNLAGGPFVTGTVTSAAGLTMTDNTKTWTLNEWNGYSVLKTTAPYNVPIVSSSVANPSIITTSIPHGLVSTDVVQIRNHSGSTPRLIGVYDITVIDATTFSLQAWLGANINVTVGGTGGIVSKSGNGFSEIKSNTTTGQLTFESDSYATALSFTAGDTYEIWKVTESIDQPGRSGGVDLAGTDPPNPALGTAANQADDPLYEWNNTYNSGSNIQFSAPNDNVRINEHFYNDTQKPGYTAYTYPHPLVTAEAAPSTTGLSAPRNLSRVGARLPVRKVVR